MAVKKIRKADGSYVIKGSGGRIVGNAPSEKTLRGVSAPGQAPVALLDGLDRLASTPSIVVPYQPAQEADRLAFAMGSGGGIRGWRERRKTRRELEALFGPIDWSDTDLVPAPTTSNTPAAPAPEPSPVAAAAAPVEARRPQATDVGALRAYSGSYGTLWLRGSGEDGDFYRMGDNVRMLYCEAGEYGVERGSEWASKPHVLIQYGTYAQRYDLDDVSFSPKP